jgi:osmotically-inducible protein OsmY
MNSRLLRALLVGVSMTVSVASYAQSSDAQTSAGMSSGTTTTSKKATPADKALAKSVRRALSKAQGFDVSGVFVRARGGAVTLSGTVKSGDQIQQAEDITKSVQGVTSVTNKLALFHGGNG